MDELKTTPRSRAMMQRLRERLVEKSQRLDEDVARLILEATRLIEDAQRLGEDVAQLTTVAQRLDRDAGRLGDQTAVMNDRLTALRNLVNDLLNTAHPGRGRRARPPGRTIGGMKRRPQQRGFRVGSPLPYSHPCTRRRLSSGPLQARKERE